MVWKTDRNPVLFPCNTWSEDEQRWIIAEAWSGRILLLAPLSYMGGKLMDYSLCIPHAEREESIQEIRVEAKEHEEARIYAQTKLNVAFGLPKWRRSMGYEV